MISVARPKTSIKISMFTLFLDIVAFQPRCLLAKSVSFMIEVPSILFQRGKGSNYNYIRFQSPLTKECFDIKELSLKGHHNKLHSTHMCYICTYLLNDCLFTVARLGMSIHISIFLSPSCLLFLGDKFPYRYIMPL